MTSDDLKRIFLGPTLFRLDTVLSPRLIPVLYVTGLATLLLWAVTHLFDTFARNFGDGLWGLLEIVVFGGFGLVVLRVGCEALLVFFKAHEEATDSVSRSRISSTLLEEVRDSRHSGRRRRRGPDQPSNRPPPRRERHFTARPTPNSAAHAAALGCRVLPPERVVDSEGAWSCQQAEQRGRLAGVGRLGDGAHRHVHHPEDRGAFADGDRSDG